jgi:hypothetical protein
MLADLGFTNVSIASRVVVFLQQLAANYFLDAATNAAKGGTTSDDELAAWTVEIKSLLDTGRLFASEGYFLFTSRHAQK